MRRAEFLAIPVVAVVRDRDNWLERDVLELARERYDVPVTHVESDVPPA